MSPVVKTKREKIVIPSKYLLFMLTILCIAMTVITFQTDLLVTPFNAVAGYIVVPFQEGISQAGTWLSDRSDELGQIRDVLEENKKLKQQLDELTVENTLLQQDKYELNNLRELFELNDEYSQYEKTGARIIARDAGNWFHSFAINKGTEDGLQLGCNVIADGGLVGRIVDIGPNWAKVSSIISDNVNTSGETLSTSDNLIVSGNLELMGEGVIRYQMLVDSADKVVVGDKVVTSNISDNYLPGILIGYISSINTDSNNLTKSGTLTPAVDFEHLEEVLVILELKQTVE